jgi:membrane peptidoglycan carboxypeptidase
VTNQTNNANDAADNGKRTVRTRRRKPVWKRLVTTVLSVIAVLIIVPLVAFFAAYAVTKVPEPDELVTNQISNIYAQDGSTEIARIVPPEGNRTNVKIDDIPEHVRKAVISAEDRDFDSNSGFSVTGFGRAALGQLTGNSSAGGGSTITQQYVKNAVVGDERSLVRKGKELVISAKMTREWSKDEILSAYLNTIYFGRNAYGISAAAKAYFNKNVQDLTPEEGAVLAAAIQRPSQLDPWTNRPEAEQRWNYVMDGMVGLGVFDKQQRDAAVFPEVVDPATTQETSVAEGTNGLIKTQVLNELAAQGITEETVNTSGLKVTTTIDPAAQQDAVDAVTAKLEAAGDDNVRGALVAVDPKTGGVRSYYGGDDPTGLDWANAGLQTGSTFKIFTLTAAVEQGIPTSTLYDSSPVTTGDTLVENDSGETCGTCSLAQALKMSLNTTFIRLTRDLNGGAQAVADMAHQMGVAKDLPGIGATLQENGGAPFEGITLGQYQTRPLDMASGLATLANRGKYFPAHFVQKVESADGEVLLDNGGMEGTQVIKPETADAVVSAMQPIAGYSNNHDLSGRVSAAKTGTAQLGDTGQNKDAWMIGATPQLASAVWLGNVGGQPLYDMTRGGSMYGSMSPADIWKTYMDGALVNQPAEYFGDGSATGGGSGSGYSSGYGTGGAGTGAGAGAGTGTGGGQDTGATEEDATGGAADGGQQNPGGGDTGGDQNGGGQGGGDQNGGGQGGGADLPDVGQMLDDLLNGGQ